MLKGLLFDLDGVLTNSAKFHLTAWNNLAKELGITLTKNDILFIGNSISVNKKGDIINKHFNEYYIVNKDIDISNLTLQTEKVSEVK